jgi:hypothetical protein
MASRFRKKVKPADHVTGWREKRELGFMHERRRAIEDREYATKYVAARTYA